MKQIKFLLTLFAILYALIAPFLYAQDVTEDVVTDSNFSVSKIYKNFINMTLEMWLGHPVQRSSFKSTQEIEEAADLACEQSEKALSQGKEVETISKLNRCKAYALKTHYASGMIRSFTLLGDLHQMQGKLPLAMLDFQRALLAAKQFKLTRFEMRSLMGIAALSILFGDTRGAQGAFQKLPPTPLSQWSADMTAQYYYLRFFISRAQAQHNRGAPEFASLALTPLESLHGKLSSLGLLYYWHAKAQGALDLGQNTEAMSAASEGMKVLTSLRKSTEDLNREQIWLLKYKEITGRALASRGQWEQATVSLEQARDSFYQVRLDSFGNERLIQGLSQQHRILFQTLVESYTKLARIEEAFKIHLDLKSLLLGDSFNVRVFAEDEEKEKSFYENKKALQQYFIKSGGLAKRASVTDWQQGLQKIVTDKNSVFQNVVFQSTAMPLATLGLELSVLQKTLPAESVYVDYLMTEEKIWTFVVTRQDVQVFQLSVQDRKLQRQVERFLTLLSNPQLSYYQESAQKLYQELLGPLQGILSRHKKILISAQGLLASLPFQALHDGKKFMAEAWEISMVPQALWLLRQSDATVAMSDPGVLLVQHGSLQRSPASTKIVTALDAPTYLAGFNKTLSLYGEQATKSNIFNTLNKSKFLNSLHMQMKLELKNSSQGLYVGFPLEEESYSCYDLLRGGLQDVRLLTLAHLENSDLEGALLTLLLTSVLQSGVNTTVFSYWNVESEEAEPYLKEFYRQYRTGRSVVSSHAQAIRTVLKNPQTAHPYYWAAYAVVGGGV